MVFNQVTAAYPACVEHPPRFLLRVRGSALETFDARLPLWVHPPASWLTLMPDPNFGEMGEAAIENLAPPAFVRWLDNSVAVPRGAARDDHMLFESADGRRRLLVAEGQWCGFSDLEVSLERTSGDPAPLSVVHADGREHLVVSPLAPGWPGWHTIDVERGDPGALFFHAQERHLAQRPAAGRRFAARPPWLWIDGALDAVPMEQTVLYTSSGLDGVPVRDLLREKQARAAVRSHFVDSAWLGVDGDIVCFGRDLEPFAMNDDERALIAGFIAGQMPARVAWLRALREQLELLSVEQRRAWRDAARQR